MPSFCGSCGAPIGAQAGFCGGCGARAGAMDAPPISPPPHAPQPTAAVAPLGAKTASAGGSVVKIVLIAVGVLFVFGAISLGGMYYAAHRYVRMAEEATGLKAGDVVRSIGEAAKRSGQSGREEKRDGCLLLSKEEASAILEIDVIRTDGKVNDQETGEHCDFFVKPGTIEENVERVKASAEAVKDNPASETKPNQLPPGAVDMNKNIARATLEAARNGEAPYFAFTVERQDGKIALQAFKLADRLGGGDLASGGAASAPLGVGDQAAIGMAESRLCVLKDHSAVTLDLTQVTGGRAKGIAIAKAILARL